MAYQAKDLYQAASTAMVDLDSNTRRWTWNYTEGQTDPSLQPMLNLAVMEVAFQRPDVAALVEAVELATGTQQSLDADTLKLLDVICNAGSDGTTLGPVVTHVDRKSLDAISPSWYADQSAKEQEIKHYIVDEDTQPGTFFVYPGVSGDATVYVKLSRAKTPGKVTSPDDVLPIDDTWFAPLYHALLYQIFTGDSGDANFQRGVHHLQTFANSLGVKGKIDMAFMPKAGE